MSASLSFILALITQLGPLAVNVEQLIAQVTADFNPSDKAQVQAALAAAKAGDDAAESNLDNTQ